MKVSIHEKNNKNINIKTYIESFFFDKKKLYLLADIFLRYCKTKKKDSLLYRYTKKKKIISVSITVAKGIKISNICSELYAKM